VLRMRNAYSVASKTKGKKPLRRLGNG
jgi:hypothetical protein